MLIAIVLDRPLQEAQDLVDQPLPVPAGDQTSPRGQEIAPDLRAKCSAPSKVMPRNKRQPAAKNARTPPETWTITNSSNRLGATRGCPWMAHRLTFSLFRIQPKIEQSGHFARQKLLTASLRLK